MKLFLSVSAMLATGTLAASHEGAAPAASPVDGQTECKKDVGKTEVTFMCEYYQTCITAANASFSQCIPKGNTACYKYKELGTSGDIREAHSVGCTPYQTCCDGQCCGPNEQCMEAWANGDGTAKPLGPFKYGDETIQHIEMVARNDWKTDKGVAIANKPRVCVPLMDAPIMDVSTGFKAVYMPLLGLGVTAMIFVFAIIKRQDTFLEMLFPLSVIVTSFFLVLSEGWVMALMCTFLAAATMAAGDQDKKWLVWFQLFFMWVYFGGSSSFMFERTAGTNFFHKASGSATIDGQGGLSNTCSHHFDYYKLHSFQMQWNMDPENIYTGICGREFIGYLIFIAYGQAFALFLMVTTTVVGYLNPGGPSETTKNPAVEMGA